MICEGCGCIFCDDYTAAGGVYEFNEPRRRFCSSQCKKRASAKRTGQYQSYQRRYKLRTRHRERDRILLAAQEACERKEAYASEAEAQERIAAIRARMLPRGVVRALEPGQVVVLPRPHWQPKRAYECPACQWWHITSR